MNKLQIALLSAGLIAAQSLSAQITSPAPYCAAGYDDDVMPVPHYISNVTLGTLNNTTGTTQFPAPHYAYYNALTAPDLTVGSSYPISVGNDGSVTIHFLAVYIDYNHNNSFSDPGELVFQQLLGAVANPAAGTITIPATATPGITRMRVVVFEDDMYTFGGATTATPCTADASAGGSLDWGETEDYNVNIVSSVPVSLVPIAGFRASALTGTTNTVFTLTDTSTNTPTSRTWTFTPNTVAYQTGTTSVSSNPSVKFTAAGTYSVKLLVSNAAGKDSITKTGYITVTKAAGVHNVYNGGNISIYPNPAKTYIIINGATPGAEFSIADAQGRLVVKHIITDKTVDISSLSPGLYFVKIVKEDEVYTQLLTIEK